MPATVSHTSYSSGGNQIPCEIYSPTSPNGGVIVIAYGSDGMIDNAHGPWATMMRGYAADLAAKGFTATIPDYFQTTGTAAGSIDYKNGGGLIVLANINKWTAGLSDAIAHAKSLTGVDSKRAGFLGFSLGGHLGLRLRANVKVLVEFFAPVLTGIGGAGAPLPVQIHHGKFDAAKRGDDVVQFENNVPPILRQLESEHASVDLHEYVGAGHGFVGADAANTKASTESKSRTIAFFESKL
jgi:dienelactone hydrolase